jgi:ankyrin repeat protein
MLVGGGTDINMQGHSDGYTPLHLATRNNDTDMVRLLLKLGAHRSIRDHAQRTPLDLWEELQKERDIPRGD